MTTVYRVQVGSYKDKSNADKMATRLKNAGYSVKVVQAEVDDSIIKTKDPVGADKVYHTMAPFIDSKTAHEDFIKEYNKMMDKVGHSKIGKSNAWCAMFVDWAFWASGYFDLIGYGKRSVNLMENAKKKETWKSGSKDIQYGDVVIFQDSKGNPNHTEFALGGNRFISGNMNGGVHVRVRSSLKTVKGIIRPRYPKE